MIRPSATYQLLIFVDKLEGNWQLYCCLRIRRGKDTTKTRKSIYKLFKVLCFSNRYIRIGGWLKKFCKTES